MVGRDMDSFFTKDATQRGAMLLSVRNLTKAGVFENISFDIYQGEVLGFAGLVGSGRTDVALALFGVQPADSGEVVFDKQPVNVQTPGPGDGARHRLCP